MFCIRFAEVNQRARTRHHATHSTMEDAVPKPIIGIILDASLRGETREETASSTLSTAGMAAITKFQKAVRRFGAVLAVRECRPKTITASVASKSTMEWCPAIRIRLATDLPPEMQSHHHRQRAHGHECARTNHTAKTTCASGASAAAAVSAELHRRRHAAKTYGAWFIQPRHWRVPVAQTTPARLAWVRDNILTHMRARDKKSHACTRRPRWRWH